MNLLEILLPQTPPSQENPCALRRVRLLDGREGGKSEAQLQSHRDWYWRNVEREREKARQRYHARKGQ